MKDALVQTYDPAIAQTESLRCMKFFQHNSVLPAVWYALGVECQDQENGEKSANFKRSQNNKSKTHPIWTTNHHENRLRVSRPGKWREKCKFQKITK